MTWRIVTGAARERKGSLKRRQSGGGSLEAGVEVALSGSNLGELTAEIEAWRDAGGTHVSIVTMGFGLDSVDAHVNYMASVANVLDVS